MKTLLATLTILVALTSTSLATESTKLECFEDRTTIVDFLIDKADEYLVKAYKVDDTAFLEFHASEDGTWTALLTMKKYTCVLGVGDDLDKNGKDVALIRIGLGV